MIDETIMVATRQPGRCCRRSEKSNHIRPMTISYSNPVCLSVASVTAGAYIGL